MRWSARIITAAILLSAAWNPVWAYVELDGIFIPDERCPAFDSIRRRTNPGDIFTQAGQSYRARGLNREDGDFVHIDIPPAVPRTRWVDKTCGDLFRESNGDPDPPQPAGAFAPFFDRMDGPQDPSPDPPVLGPFDRAVLSVCGAWGSHPTRAAFRAMLDQPEVAADVDHVYQSLNGSVLGQRREPPQFKDELAAVWFYQAGFRHVFCGEPTEGTIGGLHFAGRYLQMQQEGWGGLADRCNKTEIVPPIYTFGVDFRTPAGRRRTACPKGYASDLSARDIVVEATKAFKTMAGASGKAMCLHRTAAPGGQPYLTVFVIKSGAIRTFYPDASPSCDRNRPPENCLCSP